jgi:hypothetical protein
MVTSLRNDFHTDIASTILNEIQYRRANYYYFLGKIETWGGDDLPPTAIDIDSEFSNNQIRNNNLFIKKISPNDVSLVTTRYNWNSGFAYSLWDNTKNMRSEAFYCVTDEMNVYKCLDNGGNSISTVKPMGKSLSPLRTIDGYLWKYMYTIPTFKKSRFMSLTTMPVQRALTDSFYNKGSVDSVVINNGGNGYINTQLTTVSVTGSTTGSGAVGTITCGATGNVTGVNITSGGVGYTAGVKVAVASVTGTGAVCDAVIMGGVVTGVNITSGGVGYTAGESLTFTVGGAIILPIISRDSGSINSVRIINSGAGYTSTPTATITGVGGSGKYGNLSAQIECVIHNGSVVLANVTDPGINYPFDNATTIVVQGDGTGAVYSPVIYDGTVVDIVVENPGTGYTSMSLSVIGSGSGAKITPVVSASDFVSDQSIVEQTTEIGAIHAIVLTINGNNYSAETRIEVSGDGIGCSATPVIVNGSITKIIVDNFGQNYTYATTKIIDPNRPVFGDHNDASCYAVISINNGHGFDAPSELFGDTLAINSSMRHEINVNRLAQDYRQFGLLKNPTNIVTGKFITSDSSIIAFDTIFADATGLVIDEILVMGMVKFRVVMVNGNNVFLQQLGIKYINPVGELTSDTDNTRRYTLTSVTSYPIVNKHSGHLLYVSTETPFTFTDEQGITIKTFLKF